MGALLAIDVGNTNTVIGVFDAQVLRADWRIQTIEGRTSDELRVLIGQLMTAHGFAIADVSHAIVSTVVPQTLFAIKKLCEERLSIPLLVVGPGIKTGMPIHYENPREVGADRIVNAVAA